MSRLDLKILADASEDIKDTTAWYRDISPRLSSWFVSQLYDGFSTIRNDPDAWFNIAPRIRRYKLSNFPYFIMFYKEENTIVVFAVIHGKRNPKTWKRRIRRR